MNTEWTAEKSEQVMSALKKRAETDWEFRQLCLTDPDKAIEQVSGLSVPAGIVIRFIDPDESHICEWLPTYKGEELKPMEFEVVSGGGGKGENYPSCRICGKPVVMISNGNDLCMSCLTEGV